MASPRSLTMSSGFSFSGPWSTATTVAAATSLPLLDGCPLRLLHGGHREVPGLAVVRSEDVGLNAKHGHESADRPDGRGSRPMRCGSERARAANRRGARLDARGLGFVLFEARLMAGRRWKEF
nr:unnamed protein product [Digitaria exilis]